MSRLPETVSSAGAKRTGKRDGPAIKRVRRAQGDLNRVTVEFKFRSCKTQLIPEGGMVGTLQVPMLQDPITGRFTLAAGTTNVKGKATFNRVLFADPNHDVMNDGQRDDGISDSIRDVAVVKKGDYAEELTASFNRPDANSPIDNFKLDYHLQVNTVWNNVCASLVRSDRPRREKYPEDLDAGEVREYFPFEAFPRDPLERRACVRRLNDWEENAGGVLVVYARGQANASAMSFHDCDTDSQFELSHKLTWRADYKIKLYTVLSENSPTAMNIRMGGDTEPDWGALTNLMAARFPDLGMEWAQRAVKNYQMFLAIKTEAKDWNSEKYSPSKAIDEVWNAHLSFPERYHQDMLSFCGHIIKHSPVLGEQAHQQYEKAYKKHVEMMRKLHRERYDEYNEGDGEEVVEVMGPYYDEEFWPNPRKVKAQYTVAKDGDSDDALDICEL